MSGEDKRQFERFLKELKVSYSVLSGVGATPVEYGQTQTLNISRGGVRLRLNEELETPVLVQMHIQVPGRSYGMFVLGKLIYCHPSKQQEGHYDAGIKFVGLLPPDLQSIIEAVTDAAEKEEELPEDLD